MICQYGVLPINVEQCLAPFCRTCGNCEIHCRCESRRASLDQEILENIRVNLKARETMGVWTSSDEQVALIDSVTGLAFGPTFESQEQADGFLAWVRDTKRFDPRRKTNHELAELKAEFVSENGLLVQEIKQ